jgi:predicted NACHT family NTPase
VDVSNFEEVFLKPFGADVVLSKLRVRSRPPILRLYLDGLDEVPEIKQQQALVELARLGSREHRDIQIVITARDHVSGPWLRWLPRLHLSELNESQVRQLATNWLDGDAIRVRLFFDQISKTPTLESLMHVPLLGSLILSIFKKGMPVPESKNDLYRVFIELLCGSWDWAKGTWRNPEFGWTVKKRVLTKFASLLHWRSKREASTDVFSQAVNAAAASLLDHSASLLSQLVADGLLMKSGGMYLFTHLSFQEYLTACELADPATESGVRYRALERFTRGDDWWKEVMKFFVDMSAERSEMERWLGVARRGRTPGAQYEKRLRMLLDN